MTGAAPPVCLRQGYPAACNSTLCNRSHPLPSAPQDGGAGAADQGILCAPRLHQHAAEVGSTQGLHRLERGRVGKRLPASRAAALGSPPQAALPSHPAPRWRFHAAAATCREAARCAAFGAGCQRCRACRACWAQRRCRRCVDACPPCNLARAEALAAGREAGIAHAATSARARPPRCCLAGLRASAPLAAHC